VGCSGIPAPAAAGTPQEVWIEGLTPNTDYWVAIRACDEVPNCGEVSNIVHFVTPEAPDTIPPAAFVIDTLASRSRGVGTYQFTIYWDAPGDDGNVGTADHYDFRFSDAVFTAGTFDAAPVLATGVPVPAPAGTQQQITVDGLTPDTDYWIAGRAIDDEDQAGPVSNVLNIRTHSYVDIYPPARIKDLTCGDLDPTAIELIFTAPGDDSMTGTVAVGYEVRYQPDVLFDPIDWSFVPVYDTIPPLPPGTEVHYYVGGLDRCRQYFFTIRSIDDDGPNSIPSNITGCWTLGVLNPIPDLVMDEDDPDTNLPELSGVFNPPSGLVYDVTSSESGIVATLVGSSYVNVSLEAGYHGEGWIVITASDGEDVLIDSVYVTVNSINDLPVFVTFPAETLLLDGFPWNYLAVADDADGELVSYFLASGPVGMYVDIVGYAFWLPTDIEGTYEVQIGAYDAEDTTYQVFNLVVVKQTHPIFAPQNLDALDGFRGCVPLMWDAPEAVTTTLPVSLSHYRVCRSDYFDIGYSVIADSVPYNSFADRDVVAGHLYFYKVQAVYRDPDFNSSYSNVDGGVSLAGDWLYSNYSTMPVPDVDGELDEWLWSEAVNANLTGGTDVLLVNGLYNMYIGLTAESPLGNGYRFRFYFDDDNSETWDSTASTEGYYEITYQSGSPSEVYFNPLNKSGPGIPVVADGAVGSFDIGGSGLFNVEFMIDMTLLAELLALPSDTIGVGFQILDNYSNVLLNWPVGADLEDPAELGKLVFGAPGGVPSFHVSPPILDVELETGWEIDVPLRLINLGNGTVIWNLEEDASWLEVTPMSGVVPPGTEVEINAHLEAGILDLGLYTAVMYFSSNDPILPECSVPVEFTVTPKVPAHYLEVYPPKKTTANAGDMISVPIYVGNTYTNEITQLDFTVIADPDFLTPLSVTRGADLPANWTLVVRNVATDRVLVRLFGPAPIPSTSRVINVNYAVASDVLTGRSCRIEVADLLINYGLDDLPIPVPMSGVFVVGDELRYFWRGMLNYYDSSWELQDSIKFGLLNSATVDYDPGIDVLNITPFPGHLDAWFLSDDWRELGTDIRPTGEVVLWEAYVEEDGYITWDPRQMWEGLWMDGWLDMTTDSVFIIEGGKPLFITYDGTPGAYVWNVNIKRGWNMISSPIVAPSMSVSSLFPTSMGVWRWSSSQLKYVEATVIEPGEAYWLLSLSDTSYTRTGDAVYFFDLSLPAQWLMIGSPAHRTYLEDQSINPPDAIMPGSFYSYETSGTPHYELTDEFVPGRGQWVFCQSPGEATITSIYLPKAAPEVEYKTFLSGEICLDGQSGQSVRFAMCEKPGEWPMPPSVPNATGSITLDGSQLPLYISKVAPAHSAEWTGTVQLSKMGAMTWNISGNADFELTINNATYNMAEISTLQLPAGTYYFKVVASRTLPEKLALLPNIPNPFNAATELRFTLPEDSDVELAVYDITGRCVRSLLNDELTGGYHSVVWDGSSDKGVAVASGVYLSVLKTKDKMLTRKLLLIK